MIQRQQLIAVGHFNKPHGVTGELSATLDVQLSTLAELRCVVVDIEGIYVPFFITQSRPKSASTALITLEGVDNETEAGLLVYKTIFALKGDYGKLMSKVSAPSEANPDDEDDQLPVDYFIGFDVVDDADGSTIGTIEDIDDTTENVLFIVSRDNSGTVRIPAVDDLIASIDLEDKTINMNIPDGLLSL